MPSRSRTLVTMRAKAMPVKERGDRGIVQSIVLFLGVSVLSGALAAGLVIPFAGLLGFGTEKTSETFEKLPQELVQKPLPVRSRIVDKDGGHIAYIYDQNRVYVKLSLITSIMKKAIIAIEDSRFYEHGALDAKGTLRALARNKAAEGVTQGGSSITQQLVKMTLQQQAKSEDEQKAATAETYERKIKELRYAVALEKQFSKDEILERYLNIAYFGDGAYGVEAAARHYYRTTAGKLTLAQAATLAGLVKNPTGYDPTSHPARAKERRDIVLRRMQELSLITKKQADASIKTPVIDLNKLGPVPNGCANSKYPFYCEYVVAKMLENPALGKTPADRERTLKTGGLQIQTSIDPRIQAAAQKAVNDHSNPTDRPVAAMSIVEPGTGLVKAMAQSKVFGNTKAKGETYYNYNSERKSLGGRYTNEVGYSGFQAGSTAKAWVIANAIQQGLTPQYKINAPKSIDLSGKRFRTCQGNFKFGKWDVNNSTPRSGDLTMIQAAQASTNTYFAQLIQRTGICGPATLAGRVGLYNAGNGKPMGQFPTFTLGVDEVTPLMMAAGYATFAARGMYCNPVLITSIKDKTGKPIATPGANCERVMKEAQADTVNVVLRAVMQPGGTGSGLNFGRMAAGKTGTTDSNKAVWYVGYTPNLAGATVVGAINGLDGSLNGLKLGGERIGVAHGSTIAGPIWRQAMRSAHDGLPERSFIKPNPNEVNGNKIDLPRTTGLSPGEASTILRSAGFQVFVADTRVRSDQPEGTVAYTDPRRSEGAPAGSLVTIYVSNGQPVVKPKPTTKPTTKPTGKPTTTVPPPPPNTCPPWKPKCHGR